ncbi:hypothetical protein [Natronosalvus rutilus]|uniref:Uncharacterized protein n=1 Tax=Natronosalvus rutilus TaxID=2953753 RepID=A0A9E7NAE4_9EURY|nr:hypothetical protein [Natronosalvus rutilus]UTF53419.1 hypothetical protein NGM29_16875 [Natronosalvus rutilus]
MGFRIVGVILTALIAIVPLWYPRYSYFYRNSMSGIEYLREVEQERPIDKGRDKLEYFATLEEGERGFSELAHTIREHTHISKTPTKIELIHKNPKSGGGTLTISEEDVFKGERAIVAVEFENGDTEKIIDSPNFETKRVLNLVKLRHWVKTQADRRSHYWTTVLVLLWGFVSIYIIM